MSSHKSTLFTTPTKKFLTSDMNDSLSPSSPSNKGKEKKVGLQVLTDYSSLVNGGNGSDHVVKSLNSKQIQPSTPTSPTKLSDKSLPAAKKKLFSQEEGNTDNNGASANGNTSPTSTSSSLVENNGNNNGDSNPSTPRENNSSNDSLLNGDSDNAVKAGEQKQPISTDKATDDIPYFNTELILKITSVVLLVISILAAGASVYLLGIKAPISIALSITVGICALATLGVFLNYRTAVAQEVTSV